MKCFLIILFLLQSQSSPSISWEESPEKQVKQKWLVSNVTLRKDHYGYFSRYLKGEKEHALAIEPFYHLHIFHPNKFIRTSPVKVIKKVNDYYYIRTGNNSTYKAHINDMVDVETYEELTRYFSSYYLKLFMRENLDSIQCKIAKGELSPGENHKTWLPYAWKITNHENHILSKRLMLLKDDEEIVLDFSKKNLQTLKLFP